MSGIGAASVPVPTARRRRRGVHALVAAAAITALAGLPTAAAPPSGALRVCADPNNLPFSNDRKEGFENKLAKLIASETGEPVSYTWWAQRRGFIRNTLKAGKCDVVMGVPVGWGMVETTVPYYRSTYVFVSRADRRLDLASMLDPRLRTLRIGVQLIGDNGINTPPAHALAAQGIIANVAGYMVYGDYHQPNPPAGIITAVENGDIDVAAAWGPLAGYFARRSPTRLTVVPITSTARFAPLRFQFDIAMGVRKGDDRRRRELDGIIARDREKIDAILASYGVPLVPTGERRGDGAGSRKPAN